MQESKNPRKRRKQKKDSSSPSDGDTGVPVTETIDTVALHEQIDQLLLETEYLVQRRCGCS
ncbi:hypothetical protein A2382_00185 [Candidatus Woesebacteria bacterium RIFOXYB1_FULL_38_16]|uniref:Uncharacterized protein n=1 Tax=Candidatus Woesebacteria bacterium RIFOXYB1_FULL_38_16 TaxID=1802538 RepID=A0A1F8CV33_9BACT|nr:MAG: hypothetical protein A2191_00855 [Candidatus Woesebacteria bacterium RIFOXYA1_FULL_38_9]OGM80187.1 MAG: hypothetical protein A2382_00185 [Candidatus Woesebacteria bacterium RIFOXYB1_FULL_38_16]